MKKTIKNKAITISIIVLATCVISASTTNAASLIYDNTNTDNSIYGPGAGIETIDFGTTPIGGLVTNFLLGFASDSHEPGSVIVRFYARTSYYTSGTDTLLATYNVPLPYVSNTDYWREHTFNIPAGQEFVLPSGEFGYSFEFSQNDTYIVLAKYGAGNENFIWEFDPPYWEIYSFGSEYYAGYYMQLFADPLETCSFSGTVYEDLDKDGTRDGGDPGLQGWKIFVDENGNRKYDIGEPNDFTDSSGYYNIPNARVFSFDALCQQTPGGWKAVNPESGYWQPWIAADGNYTLDFGNKVHGEATVTGYKFNDSDADGIWDNGEPALQGWRIYVDQNNNGQWETTEPNDITDPNGFYELPGLDAPEELTLAEEMQTGWNQSLPGGDGTYTIITEPNTVYNHNFGNTTQPVITEVRIAGVVEQSNGTGLSNVTLFAIGSENLGTITNSIGYYQFVVDAGWSGTISAEKTGWILNDTVNITNIQSDQIHNFIAQWPYSGGSGTQQSPFKISNLQDLLKLGENILDYDKHFVLTNDIDISGTTYDGAIIAPSASHRFKGQLDGAGYSILNLHSNSGLFGYIREAVIKNLGVEDVEINCIRSVAAICNFSHGGTIENCFSTGNITGKNDLGGLCAWVHKSYIDEFPVAGQTLPSIDTPVIRNCYSTVNITLDHPQHLYYADPSANAAGGLCGHTEGAVISNNYATGTVDAEGADNYDIDIIIRSGGLVGTVKDCIVSNNYSIGNVVERPFNVAGGLCAGLAVGDGSTFTANFWDFQTSGQTGSVFGEMRPTSSMLVASTYTGWDFENTWRICDGCNYPKLTWQQKIPGDITCPDGVGIEDFAELASQWQLSTIDADVVHDGTVDLLDWQLFGAAWQTTPADSGYDERLDLSPETPNGIIDIDDLNLFANAWLMKGAHSAELTTGVGDRKVNMLDWMTFANAWQSTTADADYDQSCDLADPQGIIDTNDLAAFANQWLTTGQTTADIAPVNTNTVGYEDLEIITKNWLSGR